MGERHFQYGGSKSKGKSRVLVKAVMKLRATRGGMSRLVEKEEGVGQETAKDKGVSSDV